jgi:hypothetical protein
MIIRFGNAKCPSCKGGNKPDAYCLIAILAVKYAGIVTVKFNAKPFQQSQFARLLKRPL